MFRCAGAAEINEVFLSADSAETGNAKREPENRVPVSTKERRCAAKAILLWHMSLPAHLRNHGSIRPVCCAV